MKYTVLEHLNNVKLQAYGKTLEEAFENGAKAMVSLMVKNVDPKTEKQITVGAMDVKGLLFVFLEELLYLAETEDFFIQDIKVNIKKQKGFTLIAYVWGDKRREKYEFLKEVKAITYTDMEVLEERNKSSIQVLVEV